MTPALCLVDRPGWMTDPEVVRLFGVLVSAGGEARFVGGCVRDALLRRAGNDIDIATTLRPERVMAALDAASIAHRPTGLEHGTLTALLGGADGCAHRRPIEITTLRRDVKTDGRRAVVDFTTDWLRDAERRDFTMNALFADLAGVVFDPFGGADDALHGSVRFIGDPIRRIDEDALRILRFFRFFAWYGADGPDERGVDACRARRLAVRALSGERVCAELLKLMAAPNPVPAWRSMADCGVIQSLLAPTASLDMASEGMARGMAVGTQALDAAVAAGIGPGTIPGHTIADPVFRLGLVLTPVLAPIGPETLGPVADRLRLSREDRRRIGAMAMAPSVLRNGSDSIDVRAVRRLAVCDGPDLALTVVVLASIQRWDGDRGARPDIDPELIHAATSPPVFPIRGRDVVAAGGDAGPDVGRYLEAIKQWWLDRDCQPDRQACLEELSRRIRITD